MEIDTDAPDDDRRSYADILVDQILSPEMSVISADTNDCKLIFTPVVINEMVDSGAEASYISKEFVQKHDVPITPEQGIIEGGNGERMEDRIGTVNVFMENGIKKLDCNLEVTQISSDRVMVIGLPDLTIWLSNGRDSSEISDSTARLIQGNIASGGNY